MAKKGRRKIKMQSEESSYFYTTTKSDRPKVGKNVNEKNSPGGKLRLKGFDAILRKHVYFKEERIK